jgi:hypothetical protein
MAQDLWLKPCGLVLIYNFLDWTTAFIGSQRDSLDIRLRQAYPSGQVEWPLEWLRGEPQ